MSGHESRKVGAPLLFEPESFAIACLLFLHCAIRCIVQLLMVSMFVPAVPYCIRSPCWGKMSVLLLLLHGTLYVHNTRQSSRWYSGTEVIPGSMILYGTQQRYYYYGITVEVLRSSTAY